MTSDIHVRRYGTSGAPPLVLVHGLSDDGANWPDAVARWGADWDIYAIDQRGHGLSARFTADNVGHSSEIWVSDLRAVLAQVGDPAVVIGHSLGGIVVLRLALLSPESIRALVLEDPARPSATGAPDPDFVAHMHSFLAAFPQQADSEMRRMRQETSWSPTEIEAWAASKPHVDPVMIDGGLSLGEPAWEALFDRLAVPTLLVLPEDGGMGPDESRYSNPLVERVVIAGAGHCVRRDQPERFHGAVDPFLARHRAR